MFSFPNIKNSYLHIEQRRLAPPQIHGARIAIAEKVDLLRVPGICCDMNKLHFSSHFLRLKLVNTKSSSGSNSMQLGLWMWSAPNQDTWSSGRQNWCDQLQFTSLTTRECSVLCSQSLNVMTWLRMFKYFTVRICRIFFVMMKSENLFSSSLYSLNQRNINKCLNSANNCKILVKNLSIQ